MESTSTGAPNCEIRSVIKFLTAENCPTTEICRRLCAVYGEENVCSRRTVERWKKQFKDGETSAPDEPREGRPSDSMEETVWCVRALLNEDRRYTVTDLQREMSLRFSHEASHGTIHTALIEQIEM